MYAHLLCVLLFLGLSASALSQPKSDEIANRNWESFYEQSYRALQNGEDGESLILAQRAYSIAIEKFGPTDSRTLTSLNNIGIILKYQGRLSEAERAFSQVLRLSQGAENPNNSIYLDNLASVYFDKGNFVAAAALYEESLEIKRKILGDNAPSIFESIVVLAKVYHQMWEHHKALPLWLESFNLGKQLLGADHDLTVQLQDRLAWAHYHIRNYEEAARILESVVATRRKTLGNEDRLTILSITDLAGAYYAQKLYAKAEPIIREAYELSTTFLGSDDSNTIEISTKLAQLYFHVGNFDSAEAIYKGVINSRTKLNGGAIDDETLRVMDDLAAVYSANKKYSALLDIANEIYKIRVDLLGPFNERTLVDFERIGYAHDLLGQFDESSEIYVKLISLLRQQYGDNDPETIRISRKLASAYENTSRYDRSEPIRQDIFSNYASDPHINYEMYFLSGIDLAINFFETERLRKSLSLLSKLEKEARNWLGLEDELTIRVIITLAKGYQLDGQSDKSTTLQEEAVKLARVIWGHNSIEASSIIHTLARKYETEGRYSDAVSLYLELMNIYDEIYGIAHPTSIDVRISLSLLYLRQENPVSAEMILYELIYEIEPEGVELNNPLLFEAHAVLARIHWQQENYETAQIIYSELIPQVIEAYGNEHPLTIQIMTDGAQMAARIGEFDTAKLLMETLLGIDRANKNNAGIAGSATNLSALYAMQGDPETEAEILEYAMSHAEAAFGQNHPAVLDIRLRQIINFAKRGQHQKMAAALRVQEDSLIQWVEREFESTSSLASKLHLTGLRTRAQLIDIVISLALSAGNSQAITEIAASSILRMKGFHEEEEAIIAQIVHTTDDADMANTAEAVRQLRSKISHRSHDEIEDVDFIDLIRDLEKQELILSKISKKYKNHRDSIKFDISEYKKSMPDNASLVEFLQYTPSKIDMFYNDASNVFEAPRLAALVIRSNKDSALHDLGEINEIENYIDQIIDPNGKNLKDLYHQIYRRIIAPLKLDNDETVFIAPDGMLYLIPFHGLRSSSETIWTQEKNLRIIQTGRDLVRSKHGQSAEGLLALGGIDFDEQTIVKDGRPNVERNPKPGFYERRNLSSRNVDRRQTLNGERSLVNFPFLKASLEEAEHVAALYKLARPKEPVTVLAGADATEHQLRSMERAPRVLHLATHGFYLPSDSWTGAPLALSGIGLAGANASLKNTEMDGILYGIEAQDLNLQGTELVVLSACRTAQGYADYSGGLFGLIRALRTAGAANILVTLRPIGDVTARDFMAFFYSEWLSQTSSDPSAALQAVQRRLINDDPEFDWTAFVMIGRQ